MTVFRVPRQPPDPRRQGHCPVCQAFQGERCFGRVANGVHRKRLEANGIDPARCLRCLKPVGVNLAAGSDCSAVPCAWT
ncbi:hypothetical protein [Streptomyces violascens]|uniref:hypothetical protein n=1 Tax=Streptomyces violascens TaxID=67381 RepID=UPI001671BDB2|nr:hypothetical protein [Streptomyces violascens]GGU52185.1 hypothetical protein GCM10010289_85600 [Streptomyces violascens]